MKQQSILLVIFTLLIFSSCDDNGANIPDPPEVSSVLVTNAGNFFDSNGSITTFDPETQNTIQQAFENANGRPLAGIIQSASIIDDQFYIVLNNADKIEVVEPETFTSVGTIETSRTPVSIVSDGNGQGYVSNLFDNSVSLIDLENMEETGATIAVGASPQAMVRVDNRIFVANNGFGNDNTLSVINTQSQTVETTITVGNGPAEMNVDQSNQIWVVCNGLIAFDEDFNRTPEDDIPGNVSVVDGATANVISNIDTGGHPNGMALNEQTGRGYLLNNGVQTINLNTREIEGEVFIDRFFNAIAYSADNELIYVGQSNGFLQPGQAIRYNLNGTAVDSFAVGIAPNGFRFLQN